MATDVIFMGWNRAVPGREAQAGQHFQEYLGYLGKLQQTAQIESFEAVLLSPHGGDLNGFFLLRGDSAKLNALPETTEWVTHVTRANVNLEGFGTVRGVTGEGVMAWMATWAEVMQG